MRIFGYEKLENIKILPGVRGQPPRLEKMICKGAYYVKNRKYQEDIILNKQGYLIDGYTSYLIAKDSRRKYVKVKVEKY